MLLQRQHLYNIHLSTLSSAWNEQLMFTFWCYHLVILYLNHTECVIDRQISFRFSTQNQKGYNKKCHLLISIWINMQIHFHSWTWIWKLMQLFGVLTKLYIGFVKHDAAFYSFGNHSPSITSALMFKERSLLFISTHHMVRCTDVSI